MNYDMAGSWWDVHFKDFSEQLAGLIAYPSVSNEQATDPEHPYGRACAEVLSYFGEVGRGFGFQVVNHENQCEVVSWGNEKDSSCIGIFNHLDVVPAGTGWTYSPFTMTIDGDKIIGRGTGDNKGPALMVLYALFYLKQQGWMPKHTIKQFLGANEEKDMKDIIWYVSHCPMPLFSLVADASFPVCYGEKGILILDCQRSMGCSSRIRSWSSGVSSNAVPSLATAVVLYSMDALQKEASRCPDIHLQAQSDGSVMITAKGIAAHAAFPEGSRSAQNVLCSFLLATHVLIPVDEDFCEMLLSLFCDYHGKGIGVPYQDGESGMLTHVGGYSLLEGRIFHQNINIRYNVTANYKTMMNSIRRTLESKGFSIEHVEDNPPMYIDRNLPVIRMLTDISNSVSGLSLSPFTMGGGTYARKLRHAVGYGPGLSNRENPFGSERGRGHQPDEFTTMETLKNGFLVYIRAVVAVDEYLAGGDEHER